MEVERRQYFRLQYPLKERPKAVVQGIPYEILDLSERGVRIKTPSTTPADEGETIELTIKFARGDSLELSGKIVRVQETSIGIFLTHSIPPERIRAEELYLRTKYGFGKV